MLHLIAEMKSISKLYQHCVISSRIIINYSTIKVRYSSDVFRDVTKQFNPLKKRITYKNYDDSFSKISNRMCITIFGNGAIGQPKCVGIFTELKGFLFNCGEGVGRLCREYEVDILRIRHVFITQNVWRNVSGLSDIYLTNEVSGVPKMKLFGPPGVECFTNMLTSYRSKIILSKELTYSNENLEIGYIPITTQTVKGNADICFSYVCKVNKKLGEFNPEKCVDLNVPFGPHLLKLKNGEDVTLPSGRVIRSVDVLDPSSPAATILVVDCPSKFFLDSFVEEAEFKKYQMPVEGADEVTYVFHFSPPDVVKTNKYQDWIQRCS